MNEEELLKVLNKEKSYTEEDLLLFIYDLRKENARLKDKNKKVIKMIEKMTEKELNDIAYKGKHYLICGSDFGEGADIILDILKEN